MWSLLLALLPQATSTLDSAPLQPSEWLVIREVDERGRRPFREDAVFAHYLLNPGPVPMAGEAVIGSKGLAEWQEVQTDGEVAIRGRGGYAYAGVTVEEAGIYLARLQRGATLYVNGEATAGDIYRYGFDGYPVALHAGQNDLFVTGVRGAFQLTLTPVASGLRFGSRDHILPDVLHGDDPERVLLVGLLLMNASTEWVHGIELEIEGPEWVQQVREQIFTPDLDCAPLSCRRAVLELKVGEIPNDAEELRLQVRVKGSTASTEIAMRVRDQGELHRRTYLSQVDHSVQEYAVLPPVRPPSPQSDPHAGRRPGPMRLALSLHGAGVGCLGQAGAYQAKEDFWIIAPTNRRKFGFDWQDWGRRDAYDVLAEGLRLSGVDERFVYVTGHSMGGHGTWHLAANDPDRFAAAGPSAGWATFDTYGGRPEQDERWLRADAASLTLNLVDNLKQVAPYIIHGTRDNNVPATQALTMLDALTQAQATVKVHMQGGAGHWWGGRCVDWPPLFEHFRQHVLDAVPDQIQFTTVDPSVDFRHHWISVLQFQEYGQPAKVAAQWDEGVAEITTQNVRFLRLERDVVSVVLDGQALQSARAYVRTGETWRELESAIPDFKEKSPALLGGFKNTFDQDFVFVVGTQGDDARDAALLGRARHDAMVWTYRGNGDARIVRDTDYPFVGLFESIILYGNADDNAAWSFLAEESPIKVRDGELQVGDQIWQGDYAGVFVYPNWVHGPIGVFASTSTRAARIGDTFAPFISGVGYPDYAFVGADVLTQGDAAVVSAGWFDHAWRLTTQDR